MFAVRIATALALLTGWFGLADPALAQPAVSAVELISTPAAGQNNTYKLGDIVRARVTFDAAVDVTGDPVLELRFDPNFGSKTMTFDASKGRTNVTELEFTYTVVTNNLSRPGISFQANKLRAAGVATIRATGTQQNANLAFARVDHNPSHKVDGFVPKLIETAPVSVTSSAGRDGSYAIGDAIDITATFNEPMTVTTAGTPVAGPRVAFTVGTAVKHAVYHSGIGTTALVFRYTVEEGDADADGISVGADALSPNGGAITDLAGNAATATHAAPSAFTEHKVDGVRPTVSGAKAAGTQLKVYFSEPMGTASGLLNGAFAVTKGGSTVNLSGAPAISGNALTLTLASAVLATDTGVKVSYVKPSSGTGNRLIDAAGNEAAGFSDHDVTVVEEIKDRPGAPAQPTVAAGGTSSVRVSWTAPDMTGKPAITGYDVRWFKGDADPDEDTQWTWHNHDGTGTSTTITGLDAGSDYRVQVRAENADGKGDWSTSGQGSTSLALLPASCGQSTNPDSRWINSVTATRTSITVTLNTPPEAGGVNIQVCVPVVFGGREQYQAQYGLWIETPAAGSYTVERTEGRNLKQGTDYWVRVYQLYGGAESPWHYVRTKSNVAPRFGPDAPATLAVAENSAAGTVVGTVAATDANTGDTLTYSLVSQASNGTDHEAFAIDSNGRITVADGATLDRDTQSSYAITVQVHDGLDARGRPGHLRWTRPTT